MSKQMDRSDAFDACYVNNFYKIRSFIRGYLQDDELAQDLSQEVFMTLWENRDKVDFSESVLPYLFLIAKNKTINFLKKRITGRKYSGYVLNHSKVELDFMALSHNTSTSVYTKEISQLIQQAITEMPLQTQETFLLSRGNELTYHEVAFKQGVSVKTIEYRISCALKIMRKYLKDYMPFYIGYLLLSMFD